MVGKFAGRVTVLSMTAPERSAYNTPVHAEAFADGMRA